jgi:hypothetical protein
MTATFSFQPGNSETSIVLKHGAIKRTFFFKLVMTVNIRNLIKCYTVTCRHGLELPQPPMFPAVWIQSKGKPPNTIPAIPSRTRQCTLRSYQNYYSWNPRTWHFSISIQRPGFYSFLVSQMMEAVPLWGYNYRLHNVSIVHHRLNPEACTVA